MNGSYFTGRGSTEIILTTNTVLNIQRNDLVIPSVLMTWLSNMLRQEELKLPKEVVDKVAIAVGNNFLNFGLIASLGDTEISRDFLLKVNGCTCFLLLFNLFVSSALAFCSQADSLYCWQHTQSRHITSTTKLVENHDEEVLAKS